MLCYYNAWDNYYYRLGQVVEIQKIKKVEMFYAKANKMNNYGVNDLNIMFMCTSKKGAI